LSPDGKRFMAGLRLFDFATLNVLAQQDANNAPFLIVGNFNLVQNVGGSVFSPDGQTLYSAFNITPFVLPQARPNSTTLLVANPRNLGIRMGIQLPESILGKMVASSDGQNIYALSESGLLVIPVGAMEQQPILMPETTTVRLSANQCERTAATRSIEIRNAGRGVLRYSVNAVAANAGLQVQQQGVQAPAGLRFTMNPATARRVGSTLTQVILTSQEAINIPPNIRVYQNWLNTETRATTYPMELNINDQEGLVDLLMDNTRQRVYLANSGKNQVEVFDLRAQQFLPPIEVGQFPRSMALGSDGRTLFVANAGGEWISMVDLDERREYDRIAFPPLPFNATQAPFTPRVISMGIYGLQIFASTAANAAGTLWSSSGKLAVPRQISNAIGTAAIPAPVSMVGTPGNEQVMLLAGNSIAYLYDSQMDDYIVARQVMAPPVTSYYGNVGAGPEGRYFLANRAILNSTLVPMGGFAGGLVIIPPAGQPPGGGQQPPGGGQQPPGGGQQPPGGGQQPPGGGQQPPGGGQQPPGGGQQPPGGGQQIPPGQIPDIRPGAGGQIPATAATLRNVPAVVPINATTYARFSTAQQANANAQPQGDPQPMVELININTELVVATAPLSEGPPLNVFGNGRSNIPGRTMAVDNRAAAAYVITASGLSVARLAAGPAQPRVLVNPQGVVSAASFTSSVAPSGLISIFGQNLAESASAGSLPLPTLLGGACVTVADTPIPLLMTSPGQINAQVPPSLRAGTYQLMVRSAQNALASNTVALRVAASAPAIFANPETQEAALFHADDMSPVTQRDPARRDEVLVLFATGLPPAAGVSLQPGAPAPVSPLAITARPEVFIGDPRIREAEMIVEWSGFTPGFVGLNQINIRVHGDRLRGDRLPVSIKVGNLSSPLAGPLVPVTYVR